MMDVDKLLLPYLKLWHEVVVPVFVGGSWRDVCNDCPYRIIKRQ